MISSTGHRFVFLLLPFVLSTSLVAQNFKTFEPTQSFNIIDANGRPLQLIQTLKTEGSPYFNEEYHEAVVFMLNGKSYKDVLVKFNVSERQIQYLGQDGRVMIIDIPVKTLRLLHIKQQDGSLKDITLQSSAGVLNSKDGAVYQLLDTGRISLVKKIEINTWEEKKYGEINITYHYNKKETPFIISTNGEYIKLEKSKDFIVGILKDKKDKVDAYIVSNKIRCKSIGDFQQIISYYNSLD